MNYHSGLFYHFSSFGVNWENYIFLALQIPLSCPLKVVDTFGYLGIITQHPIQRIMNNLKILVVRLKNSLRVWTKLAPNLPTRINIFKMIFLPCFLFILGNSPIYITKRHFQEIESLVMSFIWESKPATIAKNTLQLPLSEGGLATTLSHNSLIYYFAPQLTRG